MDVTKLEALENAHIVFVNDYDLKEHPVECQQRVLNICKENKCGNYNRCWTCPPNAPPLEECQRQISGFGHVLIYKFSFPVKDIRDPGEIRSLLKEHQGIVREIRDEADSKGIRNLSLPGGACLYCDECTFPKAPCRHPDKALNSNDAYGIDLASFIESIGLSFKRDDGEVIFFGMMFHD